MSLHAHRCPHVPNCYPKQHDSINWQVVCVVELSLVFIQVQFQLQQTMGGSAVAPISGRSASKSPARRSPTKHRPFHLSDSPWKSSPSDTAPVGNSQTLPAASRKSASPQKGRSPSRTTGLSAKGISPVKKQAGTQNHQTERQSAAAGPGTNQKTYSPGVMSFGSYGGVAFSSFAPAMPAGMVESDDAAADVDDEGTARFTCNLWQACYLKDQQSAESSSASCMSLYHHRISDRCPSLSSVTHEHYIYAAVWVSIPVVFWTWGASTVAPLPRCICNLHRQHLPV